MVICSRVFPTNFIEYKADGLPVLHTSKRWHVCLRIHPFFFFLYQCYTQAMDGIFHYSLSFFFSSSYLPFLCLYLPYCFLSLPLSVFLTLAISFFLFVPFSLFIFTHLSNVFLFKIHFVFCLSSIYNFIRLREIDTVKNFCFAIIQ